MSFVYILEGERFYIGSTVDLLQRIKDHRRGNTATTKRIGDWKLVWSKEFETLAEARFFERKIKKWKSRKMIELLVEGKINL